MIPPNDPKDTTNGVSMTEEKRPAREWWIRESRCTGKKSVHKTWLECINETEHNDEDIHVIEHSAYAALEAELAELRNAMNSDRGYADIAMDLAAAKEEIERLNRDYELMSKSRPADVCNGFRRERDAEREKARGLVNTLNWIGAIAVAPKGSWPTIEACAQEANEALAKYGEET